MAQRLEAVREEVRKACRNGASQHTYEVLEHAIAPHIPRRHSRLIELLRQNPELAGDSIDDGEAVCTVGDAIMRVVHVRLHEAAFEELQVLRPSSGVVATP